jgi:hypothetical protein
MQFATKLRGASAALAAVLLCEVGALGATITGTVIRVEARADNSCRYVGVKSAADGSVLYLRIPTGAGSEGIMSLAATALATRSSVQVEYGTTSTCGTPNEPAISIIGLLASS